MLDDGLLDRHALALCSTAVDDAGNLDLSNGSTARWPPVECPRDFVTRLGFNGREAGSNARSMNMITMRTMAWSE